MVKQAEEVENFLNFNDADDDDFFIISSASRARFHFKISPL